MGCRRRSTPTGSLYLRQADGRGDRHGDVALTQFGRMCATLGIRIIAANSPQAKGRVERGNGTHQDRLVKKLRRRGIGDYDTANAFLATTYLPDHNARFARAPASPEDFHTPLPAGVDLDQVFRLETTRTLGHDWVVRHDNRLLQVERHGRHYPPSRTTVLVCEYEDGHLELWYRGQRLPWTGITGQRPPRAPALRAGQQEPRPRRQSRWRPPPQHPWRRDFRLEPDWLSPGEQTPGRIPVLLTGGAAQ